MKYQNSEENYSLPYIARGKFRLKLLIFLMTLPVVGEAIIFIHYDLNPGGSFSFGSSIVIIIVTVLILVFMYRYINSYEIIVMEDTIFYNHFFRNRVFSISDITEMKIVIHNPNGPVRKENLFLALYNNEKFSRDPFKINITPFSKKDLTAIVNIIFNKNPSIKMDEFVHELKKGSMRAIFAEIARTIIP
jgi:hypothetical protein